MPEPIYTKRQTKQFYGNPSDSTWHDRERRGLVPKPDVMLGEQTPGYTQTNIDQHQASLRERGIVRFNPAPNERRKLARGRG